MKWILGPALLCALLIALEVSSQENAMKTLPKSLLECYNEESYRTRNQLPHTMEFFIDIIRKIEDYSPQNVDVLDMRYLSAALLHRFRQDGIVRNPYVTVREGIVPYAPLGKQFYRHAQVLKVIPVNSFNFPNDSLTAVEKCTLHSMMSSSIELFEREYENRNCKYASNRRFGRSADDSTKEQVETLSPEQLEMMKSKTDDVDPNSLYPAFPRNHPRERFIQNPSTISQCPIENGVIHTPWGAVSGGAIIAGIAAGMEPQVMKINELINQQIEPRVSDYENNIVVNNAYLATLSGDLAEVALKQGPQTQSNHPFVLGVEGNWNSSHNPLFYFLSSNQNLEMTGAEIRGDIDGFILANNVQQYYEKFRSNLRLSQVLDMYYGERGLFDKNLKACKRREQILKMAPIQMLMSETLSAAVLLSPEIAPATFSAKIVESFVEQAVNNLISHIPTMNKDENCESYYYTDASQSSNFISEPAVNLTIVIDTTWPFEMIEKILIQLIRSKLQINKFNSQITILDAVNGSVILNSIHRLVDIINFNKTMYNRLYGPFDLPKTLDNLRLLKMENLDREKNTKWGGGKSDVVVIIPYQSSLRTEDKYYYKENLQKMKEDVPDTVFLFLTPGPKDHWSDLVVNPDTDIISINTGDNLKHFPAIDLLVNRIKQVPRRLINTQCGANYEGSGPSHSMSDTVAPGGINYYRMHPNYFYSDSDPSPKIKIRTQDSNSLTVCTLPKLLYESVMEAQNKTDCSTVSPSKPLTIPLHCDGASYIHECKPIYLSVSANATTTNSYTCSDPVKCKYPDSISFTISYENLVCRNGTATFHVSPIFLLIIFALYIY